MKQKDQTKSVLRFSPSAWAKLSYMRDATENEVGGFGITDKKDLLFVKDFVVIKQEVSSVTVVFDDEAVANFFEDQVAAGRNPQQFARIWIHTHPGMSPTPSSTDEETFERVFGSCDWSIMFIISSYDETYARLRFNAGPGGSVKLPVKVDYTSKFEGSDFELWGKIYCENVNTQLYQKVVSEKSDLRSELLTGSKNLSADLDMSDVIFDKFEQMDPEDRRMFMNELAYRYSYENEIYL